jgi:hypothetical protein
LISVELKASKALRHTLLSFMFWALDKECGSLAISKATVLTGDI